MIIQQKELTIPKHAEPFFRKHLWPKDRPIVSCVMASRNSVSVILPTFESIECQSFDNFELVVVCDENIQQVQKVLRNSKLKIKKIAVEHKYSLGQLKGIGVFGCSADIVVSLDDDDLYGPEHIETITAPIRNNSADAVMYSKVTLLDKTDNKKYICEFPAGYAPSIAAKWDCLCQMRFLPGGNEDEILKKSLYATKNVRVTVLDNDPSLYTYVFHGNNMWGSRERFLRLADKGTRIFDAKTKEEKLKIALERVSPGFKGLTT